MIMWVIKVNGIIVRVYATQARGDEDRVLVETIKAHSCCDAQIEFEQVPVETSWPGFVEDMKVEA